MTCGYCNKDIEQCQCYEGYSDTEEEYECSSCCRYLIQQDIDSMRYDECMHCWLERNGD